MPLVKSIFRLLAPASGFSMGDSQKITIKTLLQRVPNLAPGLLKHQD